MEKSPCMVCYKPTEYEPVMCCNGSIQSECGCMGQPLEPCICSQKCYNALISGIGKTLNERRINAGIELFKD